MYQITIKGLSGKSYKEAYNDQDDEDESYDLTPGEIKKILPLKIPDEFVEYSDLNIKGLLNGYTHFELIDDELWSVCIYKSKVELTEDQLQALAEETQGQWSDGIGEGFEQYPCAKIGKYEVFISPWYFGQELIIEQTKV